MVVDVPAELEEKNKKIIGKMSLFFYIVNGKRNIFEEQLKNEKMCSD